MKRIYDDSTVTSVRLERRDILLAKSLGISLSEALSSGIRNYAEVYIEMHPDPKPEWKHCLIDLKERDLKRQREKLKIEEASQTIIENYLKVYSEEKLEDTLKPDTIIHVWNRFTRRWEDIPESQFHESMHVKDAVSYTL